MAAMKVHFARGGSSRNPHFRQAAIASEDLGDAWNAKPAIEIGNRHWRFHGLSAGLRILPVFLLILECRARVEPSIISQLP